MILQKIKQLSRDRQREPDKNICFSSLEPENTPGVNGMHYLTRLTLLIHTLF